MDTTPQAEMQGRGADDQIREIYTDAQPHLLTVNAPGESRYLQREWMYSHGLIETRQRIVGTRNATVQAP